MRDRACVTRYWYKARNNKTMPKGSCSVQSFQMPLKASPLHVCIQWEIQVEGTPVDGMPRINVIEIIIIRTGHLARHSSASRYSCEFGLFASQRSVPAGDP
jgi:hypothetical protein